MEFKEFNKALQNHVESMVKGQDVLFITDTDNDTMWTAYLDSFPEGTNEIFRERREHDCSCCRHFIKTFGNVVAIKDNKIVTIWDFKIDDVKYQTVIDVLSIYVNSKPIKEVFVTKEAGFGTDHTPEQLEDGTVHMWDHFRVVLPIKFVSESQKTIGSLIGELRTIKEVFVRSLEEISKDAIETIIELISQKSLYKGEEWESVLEQFLLLHNEYHKLSSNKQDNYCWLKSTQIGGVIGKIKNHSIGVLLSDITNGMELDDAVKRYEKIVAPTNYKRPKAIFTKKMIEQAQKTITELGFLESLERRYATIDDITVNNILFANKDVKKKMGDGVFEKLNQEAVSNPKKFDEVAEVPIEYFINDVLPKVTGIEVLLENEHTPNFVSVVAPKDRESKSMFKWNNNFSWAYKGNITDSMKERVKAAGGKVDGVLRFSIQWNDDGKNQNDLDAHCIEPHNRSHIFFQNKRHIHPSSGMLDVDIIEPENEIAVENIAYTDIRKMPEGVYDFFVHCYSYRGGRSGFSAEIEYDGQIYSFQYNSPLRQDENVVVAKVQFSRKDGILFLQSLPSTVATKTIWDLKSQQWHPVSVCMLSPNYWDKQSGIGHKHYFFILDGCKNDAQPNGFFNEFLNENLLEHKRVFEALGGQMRVEPSEEQLSGLGFSSTKRGSMICKLEGSFERIVKLIF